MKCFLISLAASLMFCANLSADVVSVSVAGTVIFNGINDPPLSGVNGGARAVMSFTVDSNVFVDGIPGDTRGYEINQSSFSLAFDTPVDVGLINPFPPGQTPYFTLVDGFPVSDGFFVSTSPFSPGGVPLAQEPYNLNLDLGYSGSTLNSLDILDAVGDYDFDGLTRFSFNLWRIVPDNVVLEMDFESMQISRQVPEPAAFAMLVPLGLLLFRRRRR